MSTQPIFNAIIAPHTTMHVGGPASRLYLPESVEELRSVLASCRSNGLPTLVVGNASNILFSDQGYQGNLIITCAVKGISVYEEKITALCGSSLSSLAIFARDHYKSGLSFAYGIPGTVGGAVYMNAGAYGGQISDCLESVSCLTSDNQILRLSKDELRFSYRHSLLQERPLILLSATFLCPDGDKSAITKEMEDHMAQRKAKQPLEFYSCGSTFKRPEGYFAGALIEQAGLKGKAIGDAQVSEKHAGFIINRGNASSAEIRSLISLVQREVYQKFGVMLEPEVCIID